MRAVVTGACGFIGSHLVEALLARGDEFLALDVADVSGAGLGFEWRHQDVRSLDLGPLMADFAPEAVFHMAGQNDVGASWASPTRDAELNYVGLVAAYGAARMAGARKLVFPSTWLVYDQTEPGPWEYGWPEEPESPYAVGKAAAEMYLRMAAQREGWPSAQILRLSNVYGPRDTSVASLFARRLLDGESFTVSKDVGRDFVHVDDVVWALLLAAEDHASDLGCYNVASGSTTSMLDLVERLEELVGDHGSQVSVLAGPPEWPSLAIEDTVEALGWEPQVPFEDGLKDLVERLRR